MNAPNRPVPPATLGQIKGLMTKAYDRSNGTITEKAAFRWALDLEPLGYAESDIEQAMMMLPAHVVQENRAFALRGRPSYDDVIELCSHFRVKRREREQQILDAARLLPAATRTMTATEEDRHRTKLATRVMMAMARLKKEASDQQWNDWRELPLDELEAFAAEMETEADRVMGPARGQIARSMLGMISKMTRGERIE